MQQIRTEFNKTDCTRFLDLTKTSERVRLTDVTKVLRSRNIEQEIRIIINEINTNDIIFVRAENRLTKKIYHTCQMNTSFLKKCYDYVQPIDVALLSI